MVEEIEGGGRRWGGGRIRGGRGGGEEEGDREEEKRREGGGGGGSRGRGGYKKGVEGRKEGKEGHGGGGGNGREGGWVKSTMCKNRICKSGLFYLLTVHKLQYIAQGQRQCAGPGGYFFFAAVIMTRTIAIVHVNLANHFKDTRSTP